jgi:nucleoside diphosphate kinase
MPSELTYVLLNPYTLYKSRTGNILNRLLSRTALELVGARMFAPSREMVEEYAECIRPSGDEHDRQIRRLIKEYVLKHWAPDRRTGRRKRVMALLLEGEDAVAKVRDVVGKVRQEHNQGETIRDTYGDYILDEDTGAVQYFEPAVIAPTEPLGARERLEVLAKYSDSDGGVLSGVETYGGASDIQRTLVLIKPDNFAFPSGRPGAVMDLLSRSGLAIVAIQVHHMSVAEAEAFYAAVKPVLLEKMGPAAGAERFDNLIRFMAGRAPGECPPGEHAAPGPAKVLALIYEGPGAIAKIRSVLGPTDPSKAPPGTIRREFGQSMMINAAHASDSPESAEREFGIVKLERNRFKECITRHLGL